MRCTKSDAMQCGDGSWSSKELEQTLAPFENTQLAFPNDQDYITDTLQTENSVDYLFFLMDRGSQSIEQSIEQEANNQHSILSPVGTRAPLRSICPDKQVQRVHEFSEK
jgi:hypothetical protein